MSRLNRLYSKIVNHNPYHDENGRFTTGPGIADLSPGNYFETFEKNQTLSNDELEKIRTDFLDRAAAINALKGDDLEKAAKQMEADGQDGRTFTFDIESGTLNASYTDKAAVLAHKNLRDEQFDLEEGYYVDLAKPDQVFIYSGDYERALEGLPVVPKFRRSFESRQTNSPSYTRDLMQSESKNIKMVNEAYAKQKLDYGDTLGGISKAEEAMLQRYTLMTPENKALRDGDPSAVRSVKPMIDIINRTKSSSQTVYRGVKGEYAKKIASMEVGQVIIDKGFMSTSHDLDVAKSFANGGVIFHITTKEGFGVGINVTSNKAEYALESEFLMQAGTSLKIVKKDGRNVYVKQI